MTPFPFIVGVARSGTTLLRNMLDGHPDLAIVDESYFPERVWMSWRRYQVGDTIDLPALAEDLLLDADFQRSWALDPAEIRKRFAVPERTDLPEVLRRIYALYSDSRGKRRYGDKTPWFVNRISWLAGLFPEARFAHIIRDGRNVALSVMESSFGPNRVSVSADQWSSMVAKGRMEGDLLGPSRYIEVRYEDLTSRPQDVLDRVCDLFELDLRPEMLEPATEWAQTPPGEVRSRVYDRGRWLRDWKHEMTPNQLVIFESIAGPRLAELGYPRQFQHVPLWGRAFAGGYLAAVQLIRSLQEWRLRRARKLRPYVKALRRRLSPVLGDASPRKLRRR